MRWLAVYLLLASPALAQDPARDVRELGRQERPALVTQILPLLPHARVDVRREAANALGQALASVPRIGDVPVPPEVATSTRALLARLRAEPDAVTRGVVAETLGRLPHRAPPSIRDVERALRDLLRDPHPGAVAGAAKGLDTLIRNTSKIQTPAAATLAQLRAAATRGVESPDGSVALARRLAWAALTAAGPVDMAVILGGLQDADLQVRRRAVLASATAQATDAERRAVLSRALADPAFQVRFEAVRVYGRTLPQDCAPVLAAVDDADPHVSLAAIDALGNDCKAAVPRLRELADRLTAAWWRVRGAHALVSLARIAREDALPRLPLFADHADWQVRMYAAHAAAALGEAARLERMAADANDNVRHAAIEGLRQLKGHGADPIYIDALNRRDYQLVLLAAQALEGSPDAAAAVPALERALTRIRAEGRDTSRDTQEAILVRLRELGWQGAAPDLPAPPHPSTIPAAAAAASRVRLTMEGGGVVEVSLFTDDAPVVAGRFVELARQGYYDRRTFHRVVPGFVLQGGSPGANEYAGDGPFTRDELGLRSNVRGTIGLSTRGRNTGDMQFYVNLLDNPRLDHDFTVFGEITLGMDVLDRVLAGDVISRVDVLQPPSAAR